MSEAEQLLVQLEKFPKPMGEFKGIHQVYATSEVQDWIKDFNTKLEAFLEERKQRETELRKLKKDLGKMREKTPAFGETVRLALVLDHIIKRLDGLNLGKEVNK